MNLRVCAGLVALSSAAVAQPGAPRRIGPAIATATLDVRAVTQAVRIGAGRILIHDAVGRRIVLLDSNLAFVRVVLDSTPGRTNSYTGSGILSAFRGDSALLFDRESKTLLVLTPTGDVGRVFAARGAGRSNVLALAYSAAFGVVWDRQIAPLEYVVPNGRRPKQGEVDVELVFEDSSLVVAEHSGTRQVDTLARLGTGQEILRTLRPNGDRASARRALFPFVDESVVMSDGTIAVFRSRSCRIEWLMPQKPATASRLECDWIQVGDRDRTRMLDSIATIRHRAFDLQLSRWLADSVAAAARGQRGPTRIVTATGVDGATVQREEPRPRPIEPPMPEPRAIPDFLPPTRGGALLADADNRLWIRFNRSDAHPGSVGPIYDVIDRGGRRVDRIELPMDGVIIGFVPSAVLLMRRDAGAVRLEVVPIK